MLGKEGITLKWFRLWFGIGCVGVALLWWLSLIPLQHPSLEGNDKLLHVFAYALISFWFYCVYQSRYAVGIAVTFIVMGVVIECLQGQTTYRVFSWGDVLANFIGVLVAWGLAYFSRATEMLCFLEQQLLKINNREGKGRP